MDGIYMTPISRFLEIALAVGGIAILYFMARIFISRHAWGDGAQYEMLDLPTPERENFDGLGGDEVGAAVHAVSAVSTAEAMTSADVGSRIETYVHDEAADRAAEQGLIGMEDRIVRIGFTLALTYISITWFGMRSMAMWLLALPVLYLMGTALVGKDPLYRLLGLTTEFD